MEEKQQVLTDSQVAIKKFEFFKENTLFKGKILLPVDLNSCKGIIIFVHGLGYCNKSYEIDDKMFINNNWGIVRYDLRGHFSASGEWTIADSASDLISYIDFLGKKFSFKNKDNIGFMAHSTGGLIALLACLKSKKLRFGSITNLIPCLRTSYYWWFKSGYNKEVQKYFAIKGVIDPKVKQYFDDEIAVMEVEKRNIKKEDYSFPYRYGLLKGNCFYTFIYEIIDSPDILKDADKIGIPMVLFKSKSDEVIDNNQSELFFKGISSKNKKLIEVEPEEGSLRHFLLKSWPEIEKQSIDFFNTFCLS